VVAPASCRHFLSVVKKFMAFACIYIAGFLVQAVARSEPSLRGDRVALALLSGKAPLWNVVAANAAAVRAGVQLGMTKAQVAEFCGVEVRHRGGGAGEGDACCVAGCGLEHFAARRGYGGGHDCCRSGWTFFIAWGR